MAKIKEVTINDFLLNGMRNGLDDWFCHFTAYTQSMLPIININMNNVRFTNQQAYQH